MSGKTDVQFFYVVVTTNENPGSNQSLASVRVLFDGGTDRLPPCRTGANMFYTVATRFRTHANTFYIVATTHSVVKTGFYIAAANDSGVEMTVTLLQQTIRGAI